MRGFRVGRLALAASAASVGFAMGATGIAYAQQGASASEPTTESETIVVTARKREENVQDVPQSILALSGDDLQELGAESFSGYVNYVPALSFQDRGPGQNRIAIRGVSAPVSTSAATVGVYIDELPVSDILFTPDLNLFDISRVEVLRGPQGSLYGEGSMGGTIRVITNQPDTEAFDYAGEATYQSFAHGEGGYTANAMLNVPLIRGILAGRVVLSRRDIGGYIDNIASGEEDVNTEDLDSVRASLRFEPTDGLDITLAYTNQEQELGGFNTSNPLVGDWQQNRIQNDFRTDDYQSYNLTINWDLGFATLTSATSMFERTLAERRNTTTGGGYQDTDYDYDGTIQEIRLASAPGGSIDWVIGAFYKSLERVEVDALPAFAFVFGSEREIEQRAIFGDLTYRFDEEWAASFGLRWSHDEQSQVNTGAFAGFAGASYDEDAVVPRFNISYEPSDDQLYYLTAAQGFRSGGVNQFYSLPALQRGPTYDSDSIWNYEIGAKIESPSGRWVSNSAVYYIDWSDIQVVDDPPGGGFIIVNGDNAHIVGIETQLDLALTDSLTLSAGGNIQEAIFDDPVPTATVPIAAGDRLENVAQYQFSGIVEYHRPLAAGEWFIRGEVASVGSRVETSASALMPSYVLANARLGYRGENWELTGFVENIGDELALQGHSANTADFYVSAPRTIGVTLRVSR